MEKIDKKDRQIIRSLVAEYAKASDDTSHARTAQLWKNLNDKKPYRPMVWIDEIPWHEMNVDGALTLRCSGKTARKWEEYLRQSLYQWQHMRADMVLNPWLTVEKQYRGGSLYLKPDEHTLTTDPNNRVLSHEYEPSIHTQADIDRLVRFERPQYLKHETEDEFEQILSICEGLIPVRLAGIRHIWFTPWDNLIRLWGVQEALLDLYLHPDLVSYAVNVYVERALEVLDEFESQGLLSPGAGNIRIGSGGYGYCSDLPGVDTLPQCKTTDMWGCSNAQIFSDVSTEMHWEFALKYDIPWLNRWKATYYGCCEALHRKAEIIKRIPNLRKISMSPWAHLSEAIEAFDNKYIFSIKPNPAIFAAPNWEAATIEKNLRTLLSPVLEAHIPCEVILKDISTVQYTPQHLWEWSQIAIRVCEDITQA